MVLVVILKQLLILFDHVELLLASSIFNEVKFKKKSKKCKTRRQSLCHVLQHVVKNPHYHEERDNIIDKHVWIHLSKIELRVSSVVGGRERPREIVVGVPIDVVLHGAESVVREQEPIRWGLGAMHVVGRDFLAELLY